MTLDLSAPREIAAPRIGWKSALIAIAFLGLVLRIYAIDKNSFWYDEAYSVSVIKSSYHDLLSGKVKDAGNPPLYWAALKAWSSWVGSSDLALRSFSVVCGVATVAMICLLGKRLLDTNTGLIAAALFAISPLSIELSNEARCYALLHLLAVTSTLSFVRWLNTRGWVDLAVYSFTIFLTCYCHYYGFFVPIAHGIALAAVPEYRKRIFYWSGAATVAGAIWLTWIPSFFAQLHQPGNLTRMGDRWTLQFAVTPLAFALGRTFAWRDSEHWLLNLAMLLTLIAFIATAAYGSFRLRDWRFALILCAGWLLLPIIVPLLAALVGKPLFHHRAASVALPVFILLISYGISQMPSLLRIIISALIFGATAFSLFNYATQPLKDDWRSATPQILSGSNGQIPLLFDTSIEIVSFEHYISSPQQTPPLMYGLVDGPGPDGKIMADAYESGKRIDWTPRDCTAELLSSPRLCLILCVPSGSPAAYRKFFAEHDYNLTDSFHFHRIDVCFFAKREKSATRP